MHVVRPLVWAVIFRLPIFWYWSCHTPPDHVHVGESDVGFLQVYTLQRELLYELACFYVPLEFNKPYKAIHSSTTRCFSNCGSSTSWLTSTRLVTALRAVRPCRREFLPLRLRPWFLANVNRLLRGTCSY